MTPRLCFQSCLPVSAPEGDQIGRIVYMIEDVVRQGRRGIAGGEPIHLPDDLGLAVNDLRGIQANQSAHGRAGVDILFAVGGENPTAPNHGPRS